jgi:ABC-type Fe3+-hydroxamate transport system substrate-binding protein
MTNKTILNEGLDYHDLEGQMIPTVTVDEYAAHMGTDSEIVTLAFTIKSEAAGNDLVDWFERGYDFVLDAQVSEGEVKPGQFLVFVEMNRRSSVPKRIIELLDDLETLTAIPVKDWTIIVDDEEYSPEEDVLKQVITISPHDYREEVEVEEEEINEMRERAGLEVKVIHADKQDAEIKAFKAMAGL